MEFLRDGTVRSSGSGGPDPYTQQLMSTLFGIMQKKDEETKTTEDKEKQDTPKEQKEIPSDSQGDKEDNPVELCFFGLNDLQSPQSLPPPLAPTCSAGWMRCLPSHLKMRCPSLPPPRRARRVRVQRKPRSELGNDRYLLLLS